MTESRFMEHPILNAIRRESFAPLGWFAPEAEDRVPEGTEFVMYFPAAENAVV